MSVRDVLPFLFSENMSGRKRVCLAEAFNMNGR